MKTLARYDLKADSEAFLLRLEDETGEAFEVIVSAGQLDALIDLADELLGEDDAADAASD